MLGLFSSHNVFKSKRNFVRQRGLIRRSYMSLVYNELMGLSLTVNERPRAFPDEFIKDQRHVLLIIDQRHVLFIIYQRHVLFFNISLYWFLAINSSIIKGGGNGDVTEVRYRALTILRHNIINDRSLVNARYSYDGFNNTSIKIDRRVY